MHIDFMEGSVNVAGLIADDFHLHTAGNWLCARSKLALAASMTAIVVGSRLSSHFQGDSRNSIQARDRSLFFCTVFCPANILDTRTGAPLMVDDHEIVEIARIFKACPWCAVLIPADQP